MSELLPSPAYLEDQKRQRRAYFSQYVGWENTLTEADALNLHYVLQDQTTLTADAAAMVAANQFQWDNPMLAEFAERDFREQQAVIPWQAFKGTIRGVSTVAESLWEHGIPGWGRTFTNIAQGENPITAFRQSQVSYLTEIARQSALGNPIEIGDGFFPSSTPYHKREGYSEVFAEAYSRSRDFAQATETANAVMREKYGTMLTQDVHDVAESTLIHKTIDGQTYSSPFSLGRALAIQFTRPDTQPFNVMSGLVDFNTRVFMDPLNPVFYEVGTWAINRNRLVRDVDDIIAEGIAQGLEPRRGLYYVDEAGATNTGYLGATSR